MRIKTTGRNRIYRIDNSPQEAEDLTIKTFQTEIPQWKQSLMNYPIRLNNLVVISKDEE